MQKWGRRKDGRPYKKTKKKITGLKKNTVKKVIKKSFVGRDLITHSGHNSPTLSMFKKGGFGGNRHVQRQSALQKRKEKEVLQQLGLTINDVKHKEPIFVPLRDGGVEIIGHADNANDVQKIFKKFEQMKTKNPNATFSEFRERNDSSVENVKYCSGKHLCQICKKKFKCEGEDPSHSGVKGSGRCHGQYQQFCSKHSIAEMRQKHKELGELDKELTNVQKMDILNHQIGSLGQSLKDTTSEKDKRDERKTLDAMLLKMSEFNELKSKSKTKNDKRFEDMGEFDFAHDLMKVDTKLLLPHEKAKFKRALKSNTLQDKKIQNTPTFEEVHADLLAKQLKRQQDKVRKALFSTGNN